MGDAYLACHRFSFALQFDDTISVNLRVPYFASLRHVS
jgi:hypothetical protein